MYVLLFANGICYYIVTCLLVAHCVSTQRPMVRLLKDQVVKTEWNGSWWEYFFILMSIMLCFAYFVVA